MKTKMWIGLAAMTLLFTAAAPQEAHAKTVIIYQNGYELFEAGPLPAPFNKEPKLAGAVAGYRCKVFGLFWAHFTINKCEAVAIRGNTYFRNTSLAAAIKAKYKEGDMKVGFWKKHGRWVLLLILLGVVGFFVFRKVRERQSGEGAPAPETA